MWRWASRHQALPIGALLSEIYEGHIAPNRVQRTGRCAIPMREHAAVVGGLMPFRSLTSDPIELQRLADAFDAAWVAINQPHPIEETARSSERERLSYIIMSVWQRDPDGDLIGTAVKAFRQGSPAVTQPER